MAGEDEERENDTREANRPDVLTISITEVKHAIMDDSFDNGNENAEQINVEIEKVRSNVFFKVRTTENKFTKIR